MKNEDGIKPTILYPKKKAVQNYNQKKLNILLKKNLKSCRYLCNYEYAKDCSPNYKYFLKSSIDKNEKIKNELILTEKTQVMINTNIPELGLVNGSRGIIIGFNENNYPIVKF